MTPLEPAELLPLEELLEAGELEVELGFERVEAGPEEVEVGPETEEVKVTPCTELDEAQRTVDRTSAYHRAAHLICSSKGVGEVGTGATTLEAKSGPVDKLLVAAQAAGVAERA